MKVRFSLRAIRCLDEIKAYIAQDNPVAADRTVARLLQSIGYLEDFPWLGRPGLLPETRELSIPGLPYKAVYRVEGEIVLIVTIVHTSQIFP